MKRIYVSDADGIRDLLMDPDYATLSCTQACLRAHAAGNYDLMVQLLCQQEDKLCGYRGGERIRKILASLR